jgi:amino acid adenylation domain-containing protein
MDETPAVQPARVFRSGAGPDNLAYVSYTSGSTGRPKAVGTVHRGVVRLVRTEGYATFPPDEVFLQLAPISFDASTLEIWAPLLNGGRLVLMSPGAPSIEDIGRALERQRVTTMWLTSGLFHQMVEHHLGALGGLRQLLAGGDVLSAAHVRRVVEGLPGCRMINGYGPTENTTFTCCHVARPDSFDHSVPIGRPIERTRVYLLDRDLQPVPAGVPGELYAGGDGLARGYLGQPDLTASRFVPDPWSGESGARLYRTGDLARYRTDGEIEFLGRTDHQVKLRGFRIEPGEIEAALERHPAVARAVAMVREHTPGDKRLVAYLVPATGHELSMPEIRELLRQSLPEYMVPSSLLVLEDLPLDPNGKVDHRALPSPERLELRRQRVLTPARTDTERKLVAVFCDILGVESVGVGDNFFELGGHSLLATQAVSRIREVFEVELPLHVLFDSADLETVARMIEMVRWPGPEAGALCAAEGEEIEEIKI